MSNQAPILLDEKEERAKRIAAMLARWEHETQQEPEWDIDKISPFSVRTPSDQND